MGQLARFVGVAALVLGVVGGLACAGEVEDGAGGTPAEGSSAPPSTPVEVTIKPPVLKEIGPFASALRLTWETPATCDEIEIERRTSASMFEVVLTVPGSDTVLVDGEAVEDEEYTYRLRCRRSFYFSAYSNELTSNPKDE